MGKSAGVEKDACGVESFHNVVISVLMESAIKYPSEAEATSQVRALLCFFNGLGNFDPTPWPKRRVT